MTRGPILKERGAAHYTLRWNDPFLGAFEFMTDCEDEALFYVAGLLNDGMPVEAMSLTRRVGTGPEWAMQLP